MWHVRYEFLPGGDPVEKDSMLAGTVDNQALKITSRLQFGMINTISDVCIV